MYKTHKKTLTHSNFFLPMEKDWMTRLTKAIFQFSISFFSSFSIHNEIFNAKEVLIKNIHSHHKTLILIRVQAKIFRSQNKLLQNATKVHPSLSIVSP